MFFSIRCSFSLCAGHSPRSGPVFCHHGVFRALGRNNDAADAECRGMGGWKRGFFSFSWGLRKKGGLMWVVKSQLSRERIDITGPGQGWAPRMGCPPRRWQVRWWRGLECHVTLQVLRVILGAREPPVVSSSHLVGSVCCLPLRKSRERVAIKCQNQQSEWWSSVLGSWPHQAGPSLWYARSCSSRVRAFPSHPFSAAMISCSDGPASVRVVVRVKKG